MTADGGYLSGKFARQSNSVARDTLNRGLASWRKRVADQGVQPKPVPTDPLGLYGGEPLRKGGLKLEVAYRDFPRDDVERPGDARFSNPYNLGWYDFSPTDARTFLAADDGGKRQLPDAVFRKFASLTLKDSVRGQMSQWKDGELRSGQLFSERIGREGSVEKYRLTGAAEFSAGERSYAPTLFGNFSYDTASGEFTDFRLIAAGQRTGKGGANGRETDLGPAPMGVGFKLYQGK